MREKSFADGFDRGSAPVRSWLLASLFTLALAAGCAGPRAGGGAPPGLATLKAPSGGAAQRLIADLDVTADGVVDAEDAQVLDQVAQGAEKALGEASPFIGGRDPTTLAADALYEGPPRSEESSSAAVVPVLGAVRFVDGQVDVSGVPQDRLIELAVESRWMAAQVRLVARGGRRILSEPSDPSATFGGSMAQSIGGYDPDTMSGAALCASIASLETGPYEAAGLEPTAVFDLDSTVWDGNVMDVFLAVLVERGLPRPEVNPKLIEYLKTLSDVDPKTVEKADVSVNARLFFDHLVARDPPAGAAVSGKDGFLLIVAMLQGLDEAVVADAAKAAFHVGALGLPGWKNKILGDSSGCTMTQVVRRLIVAGVKVYFLSATLDVLAYEAGRLFDIPKTQVLGSLLDVRDGKYVGTVKASTYYTKGPIVRQWLPAPPIVVFGDSPSSDFGMLVEAAAAGFMINARPGFVERDVNEAGNRLVSVRLDQVFDFEPARPGAGAHP